jgi:hypothetical protein
MSIVYTSQDERRGRVLIMKALELLVPDQELKHALQREREVLEKSIAHTDWINSSHWTNSS